MIIYLFHLESINALLCLTEEGTNYFHSLGEKKEFFDQMRKELSESIPLNISQLIVNDKIEYDISTKILISITIHPPEINKVRNTKQILNDLDKMIKIKDGTPLMMDKNITIYLDQKFGAKEQCN